MKHNINWLAVQPTPYNFYLYQNLKKSSRFNFLFFYAIKQQKNLPFDYEKITFKNDIFFNRTFGIDWSVIKKAFNKDDIFVVIGWEDMTKVLVLAIRRILKLPYCFWTDSVEPNAAKKSKGYGFKKWLLSNANIVFTTGNFGVQKMIESGLVKDTNKIIALPFFVDLPADYEIKQIEYSDEPLKMLTLARLMKGKGLENSIKAVSILVKEGYNIQLEIGGVGDLESEIVSLVKSLNLEKSISLLGWLDQKKLTEARKRNHILLHAVDQHDPFPLVVLESMALGMPVIGSSLAGSVSDRIISGFNGYITKSSNPEEIANSVRELIESNNLKELSLNARKTAELWPGSKGLAIVEESLVNGLVVK